MICARCGQTFIARRQDARFCGPTCRQAMRRSGPLPRSERLAQALGLKPGDFYRTPPELLKAVEAFCGDGLRLTLDACATPEDTCCPAWISPEENGLAVSWAERAGDGAVWWNPPYSLGVLPWLLKALEESSRVASRGLVPVDTSAAWWALALQRAEEVVCLQGRIAFLHPDTGRPVHGTRFDSAVILVGSRGGPARVSVASYRAWRTFGRAALACAA